LVQVFTHPQITFQLFFEKQVSSCCATFRYEGTKIFEYLDFVELRGEWLEETRGWHGNMSFWNIQMV